MELEELKVIWDSQNKEPLFTLNTADLHAIVRRRNQEFNHYAACRYTAEITIGSISGFVMLGGAAVLALGRAAWLAPRPWPKIDASLWDSAALLAAAGIWLYYVIYMNLARRRQQRCGESFESSLRGDIDRALARVNYQTKVAESMMWRGTLPVWVASALWVMTVFRLVQSPAWAYVMIAAFMAGSFVTTVSCQQKAIRKRYQPHQRELESLRSKLADSQH